jgi:hypothetical protein
VNFHAVSLHVLYGGHHAAVVPVQVDVTARNALCALQRLSIPQWVRQSLLCQSISKRLLTLQSHLGCLLIVRDQPLEQCRYGSEEPGKLL